MVGAGVAHELSRPIEAGEGADFGDDGRRGDLGDAPQRLERRDHGAQRGGRGDDGGIDRLLEARDPIPGVVDLGDVVAVRRLLRRVIEAETADPLLEPVGPRVRPRRGPAAAAEQQLLQAVAGAELVTLGSLTRPHQIPQRLVSRIRHPHGRQVAAPEQAGELLGIAPVSLDPVAGLDGHQGRGDDDAGDAELGELPVEGVAAGTGLVASPQGLGRPELPHQSADGLAIVGDRPETPHLATRLSHGDGDRIRVHVEPDESCTLLHGRPAPFACSSALQVGVSQPRRNLRQATASRSFHSD
jgi:hypothetical protein